MKHSPRILIFISITAVVLLMPVTPLFSEGKSEVPRHLKLATTTSTENSGLLDVLLPAFERKTGVKVAVIAVGTGKAIALGENGDVDIIMVHARDREDKFVSEGWGVARHDLMHNDFVILGPASDPAGIKGLKDAAEAFKKISNSKAPFISRADDSGTNIKEKFIWGKAGISPSGTWYKEAGQGMGAVIVMANDMEAYTLSDRGTYLSMKDKVDLMILAEGDKRLFNPYGIIAVNPEKHKGINFKDAEKLIDFLTSEEGQRIIKNYKKNGEQLFYPDVTKGVTTLGQSPGLRLLLRPIPQQSRGILTPFVLYTSSGTEPTSCSDPLTCLRIK